MTVVMKIDLVGPEAPRARPRPERGRRLRRRRGRRGAQRLARPEFAARDVLVAGGAAIALVALLLSAPLRPRHRRPRRARAARARPRPRRARRPASAQAFPDATYRDPALRSCSQAGLVNNLNDALAWGLVPLFLAANGASASRDRPRRRALPRRSGESARSSPAHWSDRVGRKPLIVAGMLVQAAALGVLAASDGDVGLAAVAAVAARGWHRACLPDADRRHLGRRLPGRARPDGRRLPLLARHGLRRRRAVRRARCRRARLQRRDRHRRRTHRRLRDLGGLDLPGRSQLRGQQRVSTFAGVGGPPPRSRTDAS